MGYGAWVGGRRSPWRDTSVGFAPTSFHDNRRTTTHDPSPIPHASSVSPQNTAQANSALGTRPPALQRPEPLPDLPFHGHELRRAVEAFAPGQAGFDQVDALLHAG